MSMFDEKKGQSLEEFIETQVRESIMKAVKDANMVRSLNLVSICQ